MNPYRVHLKFRVIGRECFPSDLPEVICTRVALDVKLSPLSEDPETGAREYLVVIPTIEAESTHRAVEIVHRWFAHLPGYVVLRFEAENLQPGAGEPALSSDKQSGDLFQNSQAAPAETDPEQDRLSGWWRFAIHERQDAVALIMARTHLAPFRIHQDRGGSVVVDLALYFEGLDDQAAEIAGWDHIGKALQGVAWEKVGCATGPAGFVSVDTTEAP